MRLIKARPKIQLILPSYARPGDAVDAEIVLTAKRPVELRRMTCRLVGEEAVVIQQGQYGSRWARTLCAYEARLLEEQTVPEGRSKHQVRFRLPEGLPPSYNLRRGEWVSQGASVDYTVSVALDIPWWPDAEADFTLVVQSPPQQVDDEGATLHATSVEGPSGKEPHLEFSLSSRQVMGGDTLRGELALGNVDFNRYKTAILALTGYESLLRESGDRVQRVEAARYAVELDVSSATEGQAIPFGMKLPGELAPSHQSKLWALDWVFEVKIRVAWGSDLVAQVPVEVLPSGSNRRRTPRKAPPRIGGERMAAIWTAVGGELGLTFDADEAALTGSAGPVALRLRREHRGADGLFLVADLRFSSLGIGIDGGQAGSLRRVMGGGVSIGDESWDEHHYLTGRESRQVEAFARRLRPTLLPLGLADIADDRLVVERRDAGQSRAALSRFGQDVLALAQALPRARRRIPPPAAMTAARDGWSKLAEGLGGELRAGDMAIFGRYEGAPVAIATVWAPSGEAEHTSFEYRGDDLVAEKDQLVWADGRIRARGPADGDPQRLGKRARTLIERATDRSKSLTIATDRLVLWDARAPILRTEPLEQRLAQLAELAAALRGHGGPYR